MKKEIFIIPSWYPSIANPNAGIFIKEQVKAISCIGKNIGLNVSIWGHGSSQISFRKPSSILNTIKWIIKTGLKSRILESDSPATIELLTPAISWSPEIPFGGWIQILNANRKNLNFAIAARGKIHLIHAHAVYPAGIVAARLSAEFGIPYIITEHVGGLKNQRFAKQVKIQNEISVAYNEAKALIAVSAVQAKELKHFTNCKFKIIPNLANEDRFALNSNQIDDGKIRFVTLSALNQQKGIDILLHAIASWRPNPEKYQFIIGGAGPESKKLQKLVSNLGLEKHVIWRGPIDHSRAPEFINQGQVLVHPSLLESFGVVLIEAMGLGKPIVATSCGGPNEIISKETGLLVNPNDHISLAIGMETIAKTINQYNPTKIRQQFNKRFSRQAVVPQIESIYQKYSL